ncbi:MAG: hypothetical protein OXI87_18990 [Albidovulum sp.]|nr:hypothetical protein [Albidovulum sp.]
MASLLAKAGRQLERILFARIAGRLSDGRRAHLDGLLETADGLSRFAEASRGSGAASVENALGAVERLESVRAVGLDSAILADAHPDIVERRRLRAGAEDAWDMRRHPDDTRCAPLCRYLVPRASELTDEPGDLLISIAHKISARAESGAIKKLVTEFRKAEGKAALLFKMAIAAESDPAAEHRAGNPSFSCRARREARRSYAQRYRRILPAILKTLAFRSSNRAWRPLLDAIDMLKERAGKKPRFLALGDAPLEGAARPRRRDIAIETGLGGRPRINRLSYEICVPQNLRERLRAKEIWIEGAAGCCDPDLDLPRDFEVRKEQYFQDLGQPPGSRPLRRASQGRCRAQVARRQDPDIAQATEGPG